MTDKKIMKRSLTVICHYNGKEMLASCLRSLKSELGDKDDVLVVDNGSSDGSAEFAAKDFPWVKLLALKENLGFAGGNNEALKFVNDYQYFVLLNNDCQVEPGFYDALLAPFDETKNPPQSPFTKGGSDETPLFRKEGQGEILSKVKGQRSKVGSIGITNAVILDAQGKTVDHAGGKWLSFLAGTNIGDYHGADPSDLPKEQFETTYASGAALAVRTDLLKKYGLFPDFFMYYEDVDLSWRIRNAGYRIVVTPKARVKHLGSASSNKNRPFFEFFACRNRIWLFRRNLNTWKIPGVSAILIIARLLLLLLAFGNWEILKARANGLWAGIVQESAK